MDQESKRQKRFVPRPSASYEVPTVRFFSTCESVLRVRARAPLLKRRVWALDPFTVPAEASSSA